MKKAFILMMLAGLWVAGPVWAEGSAAEQWQQAYDQVIHLMGPYADSVAAGLARPIKCGTPWMLELALTASPDKMRPAGPYDRRDTMSFTYGTTHFLLHYTNQGADSIYQFNRQDSVTGVPNFIFEAGKAAERCWRRLVDTLGFRTPLSDGYYNGGTGGGGDGRMDIYFINAGSYYGATVPESLQATLPQTATAYMLMENDYYGFPGYEDDRVSALRVSIAHEFFHTIQFNLDLTETEGSGDSRSTAWSEMSATFMEEEFYDEVNDYLDYLHYFFFFPQWSLRAGYYNPATNWQRWQSYHMYGSVVFPLFLKEHFGTAIIKEIWDGCASASGGNWWLATDVAIRDASADSLNLRILYPRFAIWNLFTGPWARSGEYYPDAAGYPNPTGTFQENASIKRFAREITAYPAAVTIPDSLQPDNLGADYILLRNTSTFPAGLEVTFDGDRTKPWGIQIVGLPVTVSDLGQTIFIDSVTYDSTVTTIRIPNAADFDKIVIIPSIVSGNALRADYSLIVAPLGEGLLQPNGGERLYPGAAYTVLWNFPDSVEDVILELSLDNGGAWSTLATVPNSGLGYAWTVPSTPSDFCLIRVSNASGGEPSDQSDEVFSIVSVGENRIVDPYPNPAWVQKDPFITFRGELRASEASSTGDMVVSIMTLAGEKIVSLREAASGGAAEVLWNLTNESGEIVAAGPYLAVIEFAGMTEVKKIVVLR